MLTRYDRTARILHWLLALLLLGQIVFGWWLGEVPRNTPLRGYTVNLHKSIGLFVGMLILFRVYWRAAHAFPPPSGALPQWQQRAAILTHHAMYACMVIMPVSGYAASNFSRHGIKLFNAVTLPPWGPDDKGLYALLNQTHKTTAVVLSALIVLHVGAAIWHGLRRDGVFSRMSLHPF